MGSARESPGTSNGIKLALAWGCVGIPLVWGIIQTLVNAIKPFQEKAAGPLEYIRSHDRVWFATGKEIVRAWLQSGATF